MNGKYFKNTEVAKALALKEGEMILMPANVPHGLVAHEKFKMMLVIVKG